MRDLWDVGLGRPRAGPWDEGRREGLPQPLAAGRRTGPGRVRGGSTRGGIGALRPPSRGEPEPGTGLVEPGQGPRQARSHEGGGRVAREGRGTEPGPRGAVPSRRPEHPAIERGCVGHRPAMETARPDRRTEGRRHASHRSPGTLRLLAPCGPEPRRGLEDEGGNPGAPRAPRGSSCSRRGSGPPGARRPVRPGGGHRSPIERPRDLRARGRRSYERPRERHEERPHERADERSGQRPRRGPRERADERSRGRSHLRPRRHERVGQWERLHERPPGTTPHAADPVPASLVPIGDRDRRSRCPHGHRPDPREHALPRSHGTVLDHPD